MKEYIRNYILGIVLLFIVLSVHGQSYVSTQVFIDKNASASIEKREYYNGLGDLKEIAVINITSDHKNLVTKMEYDQFRRPIKEWLPSVGSGFHFDQQSSVTLNNDLQPYSFTEYVKPFGMSIYSYKPGNAWHSAKKKVQVDEGLNKMAGFQYYIFLADEQNYNIVPSTNNGNIEKVVDEDGRTIYVAKNDQGKTVLSGVVDGTKLLSTYYVYDVAGNLSRVFPAAVSSAFGSMHPFENVANENDVEYSQHVTYYKYNHYNQVIYKRLPGCEPVYYIYDKSGRCIFSQDGNQRKDGVWQYVISDIFGREIQLGICRNSFDYTSDPLKEKCVYASLDLNNNYQVNGVTLISPQIYVENYYDDYSFIGKNGVSAFLQFTAVPSGFSGKQFSAKGMLTGNRTAILNGKTVSGYKYTATYYDELENIIESKVVDGMNGNRAIYTEYDFLNHPLKIKNVYNRNGKTITENYANTYDYAGRLTKTTHQLNSNPKVTLVENTYDVLGRLASSKNLGKANLSTSYSYNVQSWVTNIKTGTLFSENVYYNTGDNGCSRFFSGNIASIDWKVDDKTRGYTFDYDNRNQLIKANYFENGNFNDHYTTSYNYDDMGNITALKRRGLQDGNSYGVIDDLSLVYDGNMLRSVEDKVTSPTYNNAMDFHGDSYSIGYTYDANGNMDRDNYKGFSVISYNYQNLPYMFENGSSRLEYLYDASGVKLKSINSNRYSQQQYVEYLDNDVYENGTLKKILFTGGYITLDSSNKPIYHIYLRDHLGNNRVVVNENQKVEQVNHYYPFGGIMAETTGSNEQQYKYNGKELERMMGINLYDYGARFYDPAICRFTTVDPLAYKNSSSTPYGYCMNSPIRFIDPMGTDTLDILYNNKNNKWSYSKVIIAKGNDIFRIHINGETHSIEFADNQYGERLDFLNIYTDDNKEGYTLGIYHLSGSSEKGATGFYVTPGGLPSTQVGSGRRIPEGVYPMTTPNGSEGWRQPGIGGIVESRGSKIHFGYPYPRKWTEACFIIASTYEMRNGKIFFNETDSRNQLRNFDTVLGASRIYEYSLKGKNYKRIGASFAHPLHRTISIKTIDLKW